MKKNLLKIIFLNFTILTLVGCFNQKTYNINLPNLDDINKITIDTLAQEENIITVLNKEQIKEIYDIFYNKTTTKESINDNPDNPDALYNITFYQSNEKSFKIYIYHNDKKYYIEQPYNGIYKSTFNEYNTIEKYLNNELNIGDESKNIINNTDVIMKIQENSLKNKKAKIIMTNLTNKTYEYGNPYSIEVKENGKWYTIIPKNDLNFNLPAYELKPKKSVELEIDWEYGYGILPKGIYRIVKTVSYKTDKSDTHITNTIAVEFEI